MRTLLLAFSVLIASLAMAQDSTLVVTLLDVPNDKGEVLIALYDHPDHWNRPLLAKYVRRSPAVKGRIDIEFAHLAPGRYAVAALHDADLSGGMTSNFVGYPMEAYGFGNNARAPLSAPNFEDCVIDFDGRGKIQIKLK